ncbi:anthranilate synthase component I family protein [Ascidiimonas aurantiaca]|uniref:anthranilate synthase component I family protein n=1 Tax=Ascidiimonas aurantiaca TaxID=1685432 RepID=UPI0030ED286C
MRISRRFPVFDTEGLKHRLLYWARKHEEVLWLDSNDYTEQYSSFDAVLAVDAFTAIKTDSENAFNKLSEYQQTTKDWLFGYLSYDLKNDTEPLSSANYDGLDFPDLYFFQPRKLFILRGKELELQYLRMVEDEMDSDLEEIQNIPTIKESARKNNGVIIKRRLHKDQYLQKVRELLKHIYRGDIYEANFCQEFYSEDTTIDALETFLHLNSISTPPFATYLKLGHLYLLSASPERYLKKEGNRVVSQPIKGTAARSADPTEDKLLKDTLAQDPKERSENIMITDLVRNDLSRTAGKGSVKVEELCKVYTFKQVHQMISTVTSRVNQSLPLSKLLKTTFPMGSMTGAPKISAMKLIEELEVTKRSLYSGAVGYFTPDNNFDFNVVIRSILYNHEKQYVSFSVGSAITALSLPEKEYEECLVKARAMKEVLES